MASAAQANAAWAKRASVKPDILAPLKVAEIVSPKSILPAEIIASILDYLPIPDLIRFARVSKRYHEMVYDESRWIRKLILMGCWDEAEARKGSEEVARRKLRALSIRQAQAGRSPVRPTGVTNGTAAGKGGPGRPDSVRLGHAAVHDHAAADGTREKLVTQSAVRRSESHDDRLVQEDASSPNPGPSPLSLMHKPSGAAATALRILFTIRSVRSLARQEYGRAYQSLAPVYFDIARSRTHNEAMLFHVYQAPNDQAQMLAQVRAFAKSDVVPGAQAREQSLVSMIGGFEAAALREFENGLRAGDLDGRMRQYAEVLLTLNGGQSCIDLFVRDNPVLKAKDDFGDPMDCIIDTTGALSLTASHSFFQQLSTAVNNQSKAIGIVFLATQDVFIPLFESVGQQIISDYVTTLLAEVHRLSIESYIKALPGVYQQARALVCSIHPPQGPWHGCHEELLKIVTRIFEPHLDLYLREELDFFQSRSTAEVENWEQKLSEEDASAESFYMSNINRQVAKKDFLSSFKKVVMMPVNILPVFPLSTQPSTTKRTNSHHSRALAPSVEGSRAPSPARSFSMSEAPTTELAAKTAIMNSRLEGIRSLFSLEVALNIVHTAKASLERVAVFVHLGGRYAEEAKAQCQAIFVTLLQVLGSRHVKTGFDKAVDHLSNYNPREVTEQEQTQVKPLVTFLELVNVGDLIQQMVDVFYEQELVAAKLVDRSDSFDGASKEKRRFEQMLDERVAAGLNKGIEVLMDEVEHIFATTQQPTDYNPTLMETGSGSRASVVLDLDVGPTRTAKEVVEVVSSHTQMLIGSTDKNLLDVFNQEVGLRLFTGLCKHLKRQRISVDGSMRLISDMNHYFIYVRTLRNQSLLQYFKALRELAQIYLVDASHSKDLAAMIADGDRFHGVFRAEEVYEFAGRRADWYVVKKNVERGLYGVGCSVM